MWLNISDIPDDGFQQELEFPIALHDSAEPDTAHAFIRVFKFGKKVLVEGNLKVSVSLQCSRCLNAFSYPIDTTFRDELNPVEEFQKEDQQELTGKELDLGFYSNDEINILELIKEQVMLSVPMKPLCSADCQGICSQCGKDLNERGCECTAREIDPRLAPLGKLKKAMNKH
jgi:uncharacterized protein